MSKKILFIVSFFISFNLLFAANLLKNGEFDTGSMGYLSAKSGTYKLSRYTEDDGNKCAKIELIKIEQGENGKKTNITILTGDDPTKQGSLAKANTKYKFSLMLKGNQTRVSVRVDEVRTVAIPVWNTKRGRLKVDFTIPVKIEADQWNRVEGTFTTTEQAKRVCVGVQFWWDEKYGPMMYHEGDFVLIDKIVIEEDLEQKGQEDQTNP